MEEVRAMLIAAAIKDMSRVKRSDADIPVHFVHHYPDGSGETDIETLGSIDRVEVDLGN